MPTLEECRQAVLDALADGHPNPEGYMEWFGSLPESEQIKIGCAVLFGVQPEQIKADKAPLSWWRRFIDRITPRTGRGGTGRK